MTRTHRFIIVAIAVIALPGAVGLGYWWGHSRGDASAPASDASSERKALYWYDPMVPDQHFDKPGKSPFMDMQLVPKYADEATTGGIAVAPGVRQNLGIRTVAVKLGRLESAIRVPGTIGWDLRQERIVSARVDAVVERLHVRAPFEPVRAGQPLASLIAPSWNSAIAEARALGSARSSAARELQSAAHERLRALGLPAGSGTSGGRITLTSPASGVVSEIGAREGQSVPLGTLLFRINGTCTVWLEAAIPQAGSAGIQTGTSVEAAVDALPGETFHGRVETLLPQVDMTSRTQRARIVLENPAGALAPGMFAQITLLPTAGAEHALVPTDALIGVGTQARVIVLDTDNTFRPVRVQTGRSSDGMTEVLAGLKGGERVVASGQFLIDSEANLSGALERLNAGAEESAAKEEAQMPSEVMPGMPVTTRKSEPAKSSSPSFPRTRRRSSTALAAGQPSDFEANSARIEPETKAKAKAPGSRVRGDNAKRSEPAPARRSCPVLYWYDPMVPDQHFDKPGKSPFMDMQLVPKFAPEASPDCTIRDVPAAGPQP